MRLVVLPLAGLVLLGGADARAVNHNHFGAGHANNAAFQVESGALVPMGHWRLRATWSGAIAPLVCESAAGVRRAAVPFGNLAALDFAWGFGLDPRAGSLVELSLGVPVQLLWVNTQNNAACPGGLQGPLFGLNDPLVALKTRLFRSDNLQLALKTGVRFPFTTVSSSTSLGLEGRSFFSDALGAADLGLVLGAKWGPLELMSELGATLRVPSQFAGVQVGSELYSGVGARVRTPHRPLAFAADLSARLTQVYGPDLVLRPQTPVELVVGGSYQLGGWDLSLGIGGGLAPGLGTPSHRAVVSVGYRSDFERAPRRRRARPPVVETPCPPAGSPEAGLIAGCEAVEPPSPEVSVDEAEVEVEAEVDALLEVCPVCKREEAHTHELTLVLHLYFDDDSDELSARERRRLARELAHPPRASTRVDVRVTAHADPRGDEAYNLELSRRRARAARRALIELGVDAGEIVLDARGEGDPLVVDDDGSNRRVRIALRYKTEWKP